MSFADKKNMKVEKLTQMQVQKPESTTSSGEAVKTAMFGCEFSPQEGLCVEKTDSEPQDAQKTYTKTAKDKHGNDVALIYDSKDDSLISKETTFSYGYVQKDFYTKGTTIVNKSQEFNEENKLLKEQKFSDTAPFSIKEEKEFDYHTGEVKTESLFKDGEEQPYLTKAYAQGVLVQKKMKLEESYESTNYRQDGSVESVMKEFHDKSFGSSFVSYRKDGSVYSEESSGKSTVYDKKGNVSEKEYLDEDGRKVLERYDRSGNLAVKELSTKQGRGGLLERVVYNKDGSEYLKTTYGEKGEVINYVKNERLGKKNADGFKEKDLNGKLDTSFKQGVSGTCYVASAIQSLLLTPKGKDIINDSVKYDPETQSSSVNFKGAGKEYAFTKEEVKKAMGRLGSGDPDFTALVMGYEKYRTENLERIVDGGLGDEVMAAFCGKAGESNILFGMIPQDIDNTTLDGLQSRLEKGNTAITVGTAPKNENTEFSDKEKKAGFMNSHSYAVAKITDSHVFVINPTDQKTMKMTREKFIESFLSYCAVDL